MQYAGRQTFQRVRNEIEITQIFEFFKCRVTLVAVEINLSASPFIGRSDMRGRYNSQNSFNYFSSAIRHM
jgi:hypothetical protein